MKNVLNWIKSYIGEKLLAIILAQVLTPENIRKAAAEVLEILDDLAKKTETTFDDEAIKKIRETFNIPDLPEPPAQ